MRGRVSAVRAVLAGLVLCSFAVGVFAGLKWWDTAVAWALGAALLLFALWNEGRSLVRSVAFAAYREGARYRAKSLFEIREEIWKDRA